MSAILARVFEPSQVTWLVQPARESDGRPVSKGRRVEAYTRSEGERRLVLPNVEVCHYHERLNELQELHVGWRNTLEMKIAGAMIVTQKVELLDMETGLVLCSRMGEGSGSGSMGVFSASAQALRRACATFGLGAYFYHLPKLYVVVEPGEYPDDRAAELTGDLLSEVRAAHEQQLKRWLDA